MRKTSFALVALVSGLIVSLVLGVQFIQPVEANGIVMFNSVIYDGPPIITLESPLNNATVSSNSVVVSFTLNRSASGWTSELGTSNRVVSVDIMVDGAVYRSVDVNSKLLFPFSYSLNLTDLQNGAHSLQLNAYCRGVNATIRIPSHNVLNEQLLSYETLSYVVRFTVDVPADVPEPFATTLVTFPTTLVVASVSAVVAAVFGLLVYFRKRKH